MRPTPYTWAVQSSRLSMRLDTPGQGQFSGLWRARSVPGLFLELSVLFQIAVNHPDIDPTGGRHPIAAGIHLWEKSKPLPQKAYEPYKTPCRVKTCSQE